MSWFNFHTQYTSFFFFFFLHPFQVSFDTVYFSFDINFSSHVTFITQNFYLTQLPLVIDQVSATDIFNTSIRDLPRTRLIKKEIYLLCWMGMLFTHYPPGRKTSHNYFGKNPLQILTRLSWYCFCWVYPHW